MGNELTCTLHHAGHTYSGKALLESSELLFRGDTRLKIPFAAIAAVDATNGYLHVHTKDQLVTFELGPHAAKWREKIVHPKSVLDKLGVKPGQPVSLVGIFPADFLALLKKQGSAVSKKSAERAATVFFTANQRNDLRRLPTISESIRGATALWIVYPKGQKSITEADVRSSGLRAGLVDIKVVSFNPTHTALKFVLPKSKR